MLFRSASVPVSSVSADSYIRVCMRVPTRPSICLYLRTPAAGSWLIEEKWRPKKRKEQLESESKLSTSRSGSRGGKDQATKQKKAWRLRAAPQRDGKKLNNSTTRKPNPSQRGKEKETCTSSTVRGSRQGKKKSKSAHVPHISMIAEKKPSNTRTRTKQITSAHRGRRKEARCD